MANEKTLNSRIQLKADTAENWAKATGFIPKKGETIIYLPDENCVYPRYKVGDGETAVISLPFGGPIGQVSAEIEIITENQAITFSLDEINGWFRSTANPFIMPNEFSYSNHLYDKYKVIFDGIEYICYQEVGVVTRFDTDGELTSAGTFPLVGNASILDDTPTVNDTSFPFCIASSREGDGAIYVYVKGDTATSHTISVYYIKEENIKLPTELIPDHLKGLIYNQVDGSVVLGLASQAKGQFSVSEGMGSASYGAAAHSEGIGTLAKANGTHTEGGYTEATANCAHAEGQGTKAKARAAHTQGLYTEAEGEAQHVEGKYNIIDSEGNYAHIIGNGTADDARSNAHIVDWDGNAWFAGDVYVGSTSGTSKDEGSKKLATEDVVDAKVATKLDIYNDTTAARQVYGTVKGQQVMVPVSTAEYTPSALVSRDTNGYVNTKTPVSATQATNKQYVDDAVATKTSVTIGGEHQEVFDADTKVSKITGSYKLYGRDANGNETGISWAYNLQTGKIPCWAYVDKNHPAVLSASDPVASIHVATKNYVDNNFIAKSGDNTLDGSLVVTGDLTINGTTYTENSETVQIDENIIELNSNKQDNNTALSGVAINKNSESTYGIMYDPYDNTVKFGEGTTNNGEFEFSEGEGAPLAVRADSSEIKTHKALLEFDSDTNKLIDSGYSVQSIKDFAKMKTIVYEGGEFNETVRLGDLTWEHDEALEKWGVYLGMEATPPLSEFVNENTIYTITLNNIPDTPTLDVSFDFCSDEGIGIVVPGEEAWDMTPWLSENSLLSWDYDYTNKTYIPTLHTLTYTGNWQVSTGESSAGSATLEDAQAWVEHYSDVNLIYSYSAYSSNMTGPLEELELSSDTEIIINYPINKLTITNLVSASPEYEEKWRIGFVAGVDKFQINLPSGVQWATNHTFNKGDIGYIEIKKIGDTYFAIPTPDDIEAIKNGETFISTLQMGTIKTDLNFINENDAWEPNPAGNYWSGWNAIDPGIEIIGDDGAGYTIKTWILKGYWLSGNEYIQDLITPIGKFYRRLYQNDNHQKICEAWHQMATSADIYYLMNNKLNKQNATGYWDAYIVGADGTQTTKPIATTNDSSIAGSLVQYWSNESQAGAVNIPNAHLWCDDPERPYQTATKNYVDTKINSLRSTYPVGMGVNCNTYIGANYAEYRIFIINGANVPTTYHNDTGITDYHYQGFLDVDYFDGALFAPNGPTVGAMPITKQTFRPYSWEGFYTRTYNHTLKTWTAWTAH